MMNKNLFMAVNMQKMVLLCAFSLVSISLIAQQGGDGRTGEAGASQLLINPWGQSSGMAGANTASAKGVESMFLNVAGLTRTESTELTFAQSTFSECLISGFGFSQKLGEGVLGFSVFSIDFGDIERTTYDNPDGTLGTYSAQFANLALSYSYQFSYNMSAGITTRMISQNAAEVSANSFCVDAGVHYQTGRNNQAKFGITLKNWGPRVSFGGDGDDVTGIPSGRENEMTLEYRSAPFEIPTLINIGGSYDFLIYTGDGSEMFRLTLSETFVSNSFSKDQFLTGLEISFKEMVTLRGGFAYEYGMFEDYYSIDNSTSHTGPSAGISFEAPISSETRFGLDYSFRAQSPFSAVHTFGARIIL